MTPGDFHTLLAAAIGVFGEDRGLWSQVFLALGYTAGTRRGEAEHLMWSDVDFENDSVCVTAHQEVLDFQPKGRKTRTIPIPTMTVDVLTQLHGRAAEGNAYVLIPADRLEQIRLAQKNGGWPELRRVLNNVQRDFRKIITKVGIPACTLHDLRRSAIANWARKLPTHVTQTLAGHANITTTMRYYVSVLDADMDAARQVTADAIASVEVSK